MDKTVSREYLKRIFSVKKFREDFIQFLTEDFAKDCEKTRKEKIAKIVEKFESGKTKGLMLPWTNEEVQFS